MRVQCRQLSLIPHTEACTKIAERKISIKTFKSIQSTQQNYRCIKPFSNVQLRGRRLQKLEGFADFAEIQNMF